MDSRRRDQREARLKQDLEQYRKNNPKITEQFADLKRKLDKVKGLGFMDSSSGFPVTV